MIAHADFCRWWYSGIAQECIQTALFLFLESA